MENDMDKIDMKISEESQNLKSMLLRQPDEYAKQAIETLELQLTTAKGKNKILKVKSRIEKWKTVLSVLSEQEPKLQQIEQEFIKTQSSKEGPSPQEISRAIAEEINSMMLEPDTVKNIETITEE